MALKWIEGFNNFSAPTAAQFGFKGYTLRTGAGTTFTAGRPSSGANALHLVGTASYNSANNGSIASSWPNLVIPTPANNGTIWTGFALRIVTPLPATYSNAIFAFCSTTGGGYSSGDYCDACLCINPSGKLFINRMSSGGYSYRPQGPGGYGAVATGGTVLVTGTWYYLEIKYVAGGIYVYLNGSTTPEVSWVNAAVTIGTATYAWWVCGPGVDASGAISPINLTLDFQDIYISDTSGSYNNTQLGACYCLPNALTANKTTQQFQGVTRAAVLAVGGGGGGGFNYGGGYGAGGGGGGVIYNTTYPLVNKTYTVSVGTGGAAGSYSNGGNGNNTVLDGITALGGGGGGYAAAGSTGGSGGGSAGSQAGAAATQVTSGTNLGYGNAGASSVSGSLSGGGGAGGPGSGVNGGPGLSNSITGSAVLYAGGGGGSGTGGTGGGGNTGVAGTNGLGGGGGRNAAGGSGVLIISYPTGALTASYTPAGSMTTTTSGGNTILTITASGTLTITGIAAAADNWSSVYKTDPTQQPSSGYPYVQPTGDGQKDVYSAQTDWTGTPLGMSVLMVAQLMAGTMKLTPLIQNSVPNTLNGTQIVASVTTTGYVNVFNTNPAGTAWTAATLNDTGIGVLANVP